MSRLTSRRDASREALQKHAKAIGAHDLAVPADIRVVDAVPLLGSGKTDYVGATMLARKLGEPVQERAYCDDIDPAPPSGTSVEHMTVQ